MFILGIKLICFWLLVIFTFWFYSISVLIFINGRMSVYSSRPLFFLVLFSSSFSLSLYGVFGDKWEKRRIGEGGAGGWRCGGLWESGIEGKFWLLFVRTLLSCACVCFSFLVLVDFLTLLVLLVRFSFLVVIDLFLS